MLPLWGLMWLYLSSECPAPAASTPADETETVYTSQCISSTALLLTLPKRGMVVGLYSRCCAVELCSTNEDLQFTLFWLLSELMGNGSSSLSLLKGGKQVRCLITSFCCLLSSRCFSRWASFSSASFLCRASSSAFIWALKWRKWTKVKINLACDIFKEQYSSSIEQHLKLQEEADFVTYSTWPVLMNELNMYLYVSFFALSYTICPLFP